MIIYVDIDGTICNQEIDYTLAKPLCSNIEKINNLYDSGHVIIYYTSRGSTTGINWFSKTFNQLLRWGCKFHDLKTGKPNYDLWIDDKSMRIEEIDSINTS